MGLVEGRRPETSRLCPSMCEMRSKTYKTKSFALPPPLPRNEIFEVFFSCIAYILVAAQHPCPTTPVAYPCPTIPATWANLFDFFEPMPKRVVLQRKLETLPKRVPILLPAQLATHKNLRELVLKRLSLIHLRRCRRRG